MYSIGEFSKITGLTIKTLRFYHEQGLLVPSYVDEQSGYRFYGEAKIETARVIASLREFNVPLSEIAEILKSARDDADLLEVMEQQKQVIGERIGQLRKIEVSINRFIADEQEARRIMLHESFEVQEKVVNPMRIAGIRMQGRYSDCGKAFARIGKRYGRYICGHAMLLHYDAEYHEDDADFEACMPVRRGEPADGIAVRELPEVRCLTLLHKGPYDQMGPSYAKVLKSLHEKGYEAELPTREVYLKGPGMFFRGNPKNYLTEIQIPLKPTDRRPQAPA